MKVVSFDCENDVERNYDIGEIFMTHFWLVKVSKDVCAFLIPTLRLSASSSSESDSISWTWESLITFFGLDFSWIVSFLTSIFATWSAFCSGRGRKSSGTDFRIEPDRISSISWVWVLFSWLFSASFRREAGFKGGRERIKSFSW